MIKLIFDEEVVRYSSNAYLQIGPEIERTYSRFIADVLKCAETGIFQKTKTDQYHCWRYHGSVACISRHDNNVVRQLGPCHQKWRITIISGWRIIENVDIIVDLYLV